MRVFGGEGRLHGPRFYVGGRQDEKVPFPRIAAFLAAARSSAGRESASGDSFTLGR